MDYGLCLPNFRDGAIRGTPEEMAAEVRAFEALGVSHLAVWFDATDPGEVTALAERFARDIAPLV